MIQKNVIVVGGGPAGMMVAGKAAEAGAETLLLEKMDRPGRKLRITGQGRCNLTNDASVQTFIDHFGPSGPFLYQAFYRFFVPDLRAFFRERGVRTVVERGNRVFPASQDARDVVSALVEWLRDVDVIVRTESKVKSLAIEGGRLVGVATEDGRTYYGDSVVIATGGASYPGTGSSGDGYELARSVGHTIVPIRPALVPLETEGDVASRLQGLSLRNVNVSVWMDGAKEDEEFGEMLFTHFGVSGPIVLTLSRQIVDALEAGREVELSIDLKPALDHPTLDDRLLRDLDASGKQHFHNMLKGLLPSKLIPVCLDLVGISPHKPNHQITSEERKRLRLWLKDFRLRVTGHRSMREAIVTAGGVSVDEVEPRTMASRIVDGLYFAGEVLDVDADTGGYNLQAAFSTGWIAGQAAAGVVDV